jgi:isocitrate dehydrogenase
MRHFNERSTQLKEHRKNVVEKLKACQGKPVDVAGYYKFDSKKASVAMRPSPTFNKILDGRM